MAALSRVAGFPSDFLNQGAAQTPINAHIPMYAENNDFLDRPALDAYHNLLRSDMSSRCSGALEPDLRF
jgi:hypothetical protein